MYVFFLFLCACVFVYVYVYVLKAWRLLSDYLCHCTSAVRPTLTMKEVPDLKKIKTKIISPTETFEAVFQNGSESDWRR